MEYIIVIIVLGFFYLLFRPDKKVKTKEQKQAEILASYKLKMDNELIKYMESKSLFLEKKTALLKVFAEELSRNLFFDEDEVRTLIQKLVNYKIRG